MKKIACLLGSPRPKGNSQLIARRIISVAEGLGAEARVFELYKLKYSGCVACLGCKKGADHCVLKDDLAEALEAVREADILLVATPVYFGQVTGPMKSAIDRMYSFLNPSYLQGHDATRLAPGKKCAFIITQGAPDENAFAGLYPTYEGFFGPDWFGYEMHLLRACGMSVPGEAEKHEDLMAKVDALARELMA